jgi:hypothetical protein
VERLPAELRGRSETLLLRALDNEALYTLVSGLKPMSGFLELRIPLKDPDRSELDKTRRAVLAWRCGPSLLAEVRTFEEPHQERLYAEGVVFDRPSLERVIDRHRSFFARFGINSTDVPIDVVTAVEYDHGVARYEGYGYLYGYPDYAVRFFADAESRRARTGERVARDIVSIPTFARQKGAFAWAVPVGHVDNEEDRQIVVRAAEILEEYKKRRRVYIGEGKPGVVELLRDWYDDGSGRCSPDNAAAKLEPRSPR